jgi:hypothetical protein
MARMRFGKRAIVQGSIAALTIAVVVAAFAVKNAQAHKAVTSPYNFNADIFPILRDSCGRCHVEGGPAMTLMSYKADNGGASAWAEQIREMLVTEQMPPWFVDRTSPAIKGVHTLSNRELDKLITWAAGGTPEGDLDKKAPAVTYQPQWRAGQPDLKLDMPQPFTLPAGSDAPPETKEFIVPTSLTDTRWVRLADLLPGSPIVRNATISVDNGPVLAMWVPGADPVAAPSGAAFKLPAGAKLVLRMRYQKQWWNMNAVTDQSAIGLYFTDEPASGRELQVFAIDGPSSPEGADPEKPHTFSKKLTGGSRVVAVRPRLDQAYAAITVHAVTPSGRRLSLLSLRSPRPEWNRRYWLAEPTELPAGTTIEVTTTPLPADFELPFKPVLVPEPLQISLDFVPQ